MPIAIGVPYTVRRIDEARAIVGVDPERSYRMPALEMQITALQSFPRAAPLVRELKSTAFAQTFRSYRAFDGKAGKHQRYDKHASRAILGLVAMAMLAGVVMLILQAENFALEKWLRNGALIFLYTALLGSLTVAIWANRSDPHRRWNENRGSAEYQRRRMFETLFEHDAGKTPVMGRDEHAWLLLLKLEYLRRYQLDMQLNYHLTRGGDHERAARRARWLIWPCLIIAIGWSILMGLVAVAALADRAPLSELVPDRVEQWLADLLHIEEYRLDQYGLFLGVGLAIVYGVLYLRSILNANLRNANRYAAARENLGYLSDETLPPDEEAARALDARPNLGAARRAAAEGREDVVRAFVSRVHSVMASEQADWVRLRELDAGRDVDDTRAAAELSARAAA